VKLKKKPSFCLFEGTDSIPKYPLAKTLDRESMFVFHLHTAEHTAYRRAEYRTFPVSFTYSWAYSLQESRVPAFPCFIYIQLSIQPTGEHTAYRRAEYRTFPVSFTYSWAYSLQESRVPDFPCFIYIQLSIQPTGEQSTGLSLFHLQGEQSTGLSLFHLHTAEHTAYRRAEYQTFPVSFPVWMKFCGTIHAIFG
jgi:hypothetical protein